MPTLQELETCRLWVNLRHWRSGGASKRVRVDPNAVASTRKRLCRGPGRQRCYAPVNRARPSAWLGPCDGPSAVLAVGRLRFLVPTSARPVKLHPPARFRKPMSAVRSSSGPHQHGAWGRNRANMSRSAHCPLIAFLVRQFWRDDDWSSNDQPVGRAQGHVDSHGPYARSRQFQFLYLPVSVGTDRGHARRWLAALLGRGDCHRHRIGRQRTKILGQ